MLVWMDEKPMDPYTQFYIKHNTHATKARIDEIKYKIDVNTLERSEIDHFELNEIGRVVMTTTKPLLFDPYKKNRQTGSFILIDPVSHNTVAVGMILDKLSNDKLPNRITDQEKKHIVKSGSLIGTIERQKRYAQKGHTIWFTGLHGSGKNQWAYSLEKELFSQGKTVVVFDGKSVRSGLSRELDFSPADSAEHLRRVAHMCRLLNDQGIITICSFISPDEEVRKQVAKIINSNEKNEERFHLMYLKAELDFCKQNDQYGLYKKAEKGEIHHMPGIDKDFDEPKNAQLNLAASKEPDVDSILRYLMDHQIIFD
jgi:adenylyl-sulfate kinase